MEDHLKNKNRLEREWEALCSYQAEPSASCVGRGEQNSKRNRSDTVVACESILFWGGGLPFTQAEQCRPITRANIIVKQAQSTQEQYVSNEIIRPSTDLFGLNCSKYRKQRAFL